MADTTPEIHNVIIIGSGPAGYTAALYAARAELKPLVFEGYEYGGLLMQTTEVENYPGFKDGILGPELMEQMRAQAERFGADLRPDFVDAVDLEGEVKTVRVGEEEFRARTVIVATGAAPRHLGIPGEEEYQGRGVSTCATCDGFFFRDKDIAVVGGGDSAMEEADFLSRFGTTVTVIHRREGFRASAIMLERAKANPKIRFLTNSVVEEVKGEGGSVTELAIRNTATGELSAVPVSALFVAIGHEPRTQFLGGQLATTEKGYLATEEPSTRTSVEGVFACGDVVDDHYQQAVTAAGSGCRAAIDAEHYLAARHL